MSETRVVHLVHGTWPYGIVAHRLRFLRKGPIWVDDQSPIRAALQEMAGPATRFEAFRWSGANSFAARADAAIGLVKHLHAAIAAAPDASHLIVAHSHGGTVAVEALQRDPALAASGVDGMVTLATPFVSLRPAASPGVERNVMALIARFAPYLLIFAGVAAWASLEPQAGLSRLAAFLEDMSAIVILLAVLLTQGWLPWFPMPGGRHARALVDLPVTVLDRAFPLFAIRAPRDEASLAIAAAQVVGMLSDLFWRLLLRKPIELLRRKPVRLLALMLAMFPLFGWLAWHETATLQGAERIFWTPLVACVMMLATYTVPVLLGFVILMPASAALALAAGIEVMALPGLLTVDAEPLPAGSATRELLILDLSDADRQHLAMRHSIYELARARAEVGEWFARMAR